MRKKAQLLLRRGKEMIADLLTLITNADLGLAAVIAAVASTGAIVYLVGRFVKTVR